MKKGFTIAETCITLAIICIITMFFIPQIVRNYQEKYTVSKLKNSFYILDQAIQQMITIEGTIDTWGSDGETRSIKFSSIAPKYFKLLKKCDFNKYHKNCKDIKYKNRFNTSTVSFFFWNNYYLTNGTILYISRIDDRCYQNKNLTKNWYGINYGSHHSCGTIYIDINGEQGPNTFDIDVFKFALHIDGIIPAGNIKETVWSSTFEKQCLGKDFSLGGGGSCAAWVIYNENMDYLHCDNLSWSNKNSCK